MHRTDVRSDQAEGSGDWRGRGGPHGMARRALHSCTGVYTCSHGVCRMLRCRKVTPLKPLRLNDDQEGSDVVQRISQVRSQVPCHPSSRAQADMPFYCPSPHGTIELLRSVTRTVRCSVRCSIAYLVVHANIGAPRYRRPPRACAPRPRHHVSHCSRRSASSCLRKAADASSSIAPCVCATARSALRTSFGI